MDKKGHWYTDKNGQHYFVEDGQTPQEGWEASKRRKMIDGGKYKVSEDGDNWEDVDEDTYNKYEADKSEFDENIDDDFGFDEEDDEYNREMQKAQEENANMSEGEDDDKPTPEDEKQYVDKCMEDIAKASDKRAFEYISGNIDDLTEAGLISEETSDRLYEELDKKIDESGEKMPLYNSKMSKQSEAAEEEPKKTKMASGTLYEYPNGERKIVSDEENAFNQGRTVPADEKGSGWSKTKMASGILYEGPNGEREMVNDNEKPQEGKESLAKQLRKVLEDNGYSGGWSDDTDEDFLDKFISSDDRKTGNWTNNQFKTMKDRATFYGNQSGEKEKAIGKFIADNEEGLTKELNDIRDKQSAEYAKKQKEAKMEYWKNYFDNMDENMLDEAEQILKDKKFGSVHAGDVAKHEILTALSILKKYKGK